VAKVLEDCLVTDISVLTDGKVQLKIADSRARGAECYTCRFHRLLDLRSRWFDDRILKWLASRIVCAVIDGDTVTSMTTEDRFVPSRRQERQVPSTRPTPPPPTRRRGPPTAKKRPPTPAHRKARTFPAGPSEYARNGVARYCPSCRDNVNSYVEKRGGRRIYICGRCGRAIGSS